MTLAGIAWFVVAVAAGTLAAAQWSYVPAAGSALLSFQVSAAINGGVVVFSVVIGALMLTRPTHRLLTASMAFGVLAVLVGAVQVALGTTANWLWFGGTAGALLAIGLAWAGRFAPSHGSR